MKLKQILATPIGVILLAIAIILEKFLPETHFFDFAEGFLLGLSIVLNIYYIIIISRKTKKE